MISMFISSAVDRVLEARSGRTNDYRIDPIGVTCLSLDCCVSELALLNSNAECVGLVQNDDDDDDHHHPINCDLFSL